MSEPLGVVETRERCPKLKLSDKFTKRMLKIQEEKFMNRCYNILDSLDEKYPEIQMAELLKIILKLSYGKLNMRFSSGYLYKVAETLVNAAAGEKKKDNMKQALFMVDLKLATFESYRLFELNFAPEKPLVEIVVTITESISVMDKYSYLPKWLRKPLIANRRTIKIEDVYFAKYRRKQERREVLENSSDYNWYTPYPEVYKLQLLCP